MLNEPLVTVAVPSFNQGKYLEDALNSLFTQNIPIEVFVMDAGSTDNTLSIIHKWAPKLAGFRSHPDGGQAAAINEGIKLGKAPYVCWLNSDDYLLPHALNRLVHTLAEHPTAPAIYAQAFNYNDKNKKQSPVWVEAFDEKRLALRCIISQPATLIRRSAFWEAVNGLDETLHLAIDYDLWWKLYRKMGDLYFLKEPLAVNREHKKTKTNNFRRQHYQEAMQIVRKYYGKFPLKWWFAQPYAIWFKSLKRFL